jgi:hypothetical protein
MDRRLWRQLCVRRRSHRVAFAITKNRLRRDFSAATELSNLVTTALSPR